MSTPTMRVKPSGCRLSVIGFPTLQRQVSTNEPLDSGFASRAAEILRGLGGTVGLNSPELPFLDQHETLAAASADEVFDAAVRVFYRRLNSPVARAYAWLVRAEPRRPTGDSGFAVGDVFAAFRVDECERPSRVVLAGRHRFAMYRLTFTCVAHGAGATRVAIRTDAAFPGVLGSLYRLVVIRSGGHVVVTRQLLRSIARSAARSH